MTEISRRQFAVYLVAVVLVVLLGGRALRSGGAEGSAGAAPAGGFVAGSGSGGGAPDGASAAGGAGTGSTGATAAAGGVEVTAADERVVVDVAGDVQRPGVYELPAGSRIRDALRAAGGGRSGADLALLNRAAKVTDGQQVLVVKRSRGATAGAPGASSAGASATGAAPGTAAGAAGAGALASVNVNQADATALEALDGVGPAIAAKIVDWRTQNGPFKTVDDLAQVPGIGPKKLEAMRSQVTL